MSTESSPFDPAISELETRIRAMQITLETLKQLRAQPDGSVAGGISMSPRPGDEDVQHDSFFGMTIADAAKKYLGMAKHTKSTAEIASALEAGGLKHASKNFRITIRSTLGQKEEFLRVNGEWGLTEWYPGAGRGKKSAKPEKPSQAKTKARKATKGARSDDGPSRKDRILKVLASDPTKSWTALEIGNASGDSKRRLIQSMLWNMAKLGEAVKSDRGYRHARPGLAA